MTKRKIFKKCIEFVQQDRVRYICQALDAIVREESSIKCKQKIIKIKEHFQNADNIPEEFRGEKWRGEPVSGLWLPDAHKERITYLRHLISKL